jgi:hypothetical protein
MKSTLTALLVFSLAGMLATAPASAKRAYQKVKGEVIKVEQHVRTRNGGEYDRLTIRTRQGEEMRLRLGEGGACEGCFREGDRIRARIRAGEGPQADCQVRSMKLRREGRMLAFREEGGRMIRVQDRSGPGARAGRQGGHERSGGAGAGPGKGKAGGGGRGRV